MLHGLFGRVSSSVLKAERGLAWSLFRSGTVKAGSMLFV